MAAITVADFSVIEVFEHRTLPAAAAITAGQALYIDSNGKWDLADASDGTKPIRAYAMRTCGANEPLSGLRRGVIYIGADADLAALAFDAAIYLSDTAGGVDTAAGTNSQVAGRVEPLWGGNGGGAFTAQTATQVIRVNL